MTMKNTLFGSALALLLSACATAPADKALVDADRWVQQAGSPAPRMAIDDRTRAQLADARRRTLQGDLTEAAALDLALGSSPAVQALLADGWAMQSATAQGATWPRIGLAFERMSGGGDVVLTRTLSVGLAELVTLPLRRAEADRQLAVQRVQLARDLLALHAAVRQQWVRAVSAGQLLDYHAQLLEVAEAGDDLALRLQKAGNFSALQRMREQAFLADAQAQMARARLAATTEREALVRLMGLTADEAENLRWPKHVPDLPKTPREQSDVVRAASGERLDVAVAQAQWQAASGRDRNAWSGVLDAELALKKETATGGSSARGGEIALSIAAPGAAVLQRQGLSAAALAAGHRVAQARIDATSTVRERHAAYLTAHGLATHFRDSVVPLRKTIADEMLLRYNGMLSSVFALLADARASASAVIGAIEAQRDFWLASAALDAAILGAPSAAPGMQAAMPAANDNNGGH